LSLEQLMLTTPHLEMLPHMLPYLQVRNDLLHSSTPLQQLHVAVQQQMERVQLVELACRHRVQGSLGSCWEVTIIAQLLLIRIPQSKHL